MSEKKKRWRGRPHAAVAIAWAVACVAVLRPGAAAADHGAFGFLETVADGGDQVVHQTYAADGLLEDGYSASTVGSYGNGSTALYYGGLASGVTGTLTQSSRPALDPWEGTARASTNVKIFDELTFTLPPGEYPDDVYAVLQGDYDGFLGAVGNYGTSASQSITVYLGYERFFRSLVDYGDVGDDGFYGEEFSLATKLLNGGQTLTLPYETTRQVSVYLYASARTPGYVDASAESADTDFANAVRILSIDVPEGVTWTSSSGVFLSVPEPGSSSLLLAGIGLLGLIGRAAPRGRAARMETPAVDRGEA